MKKFHFSLENILNYREQVLDAVKNEHAACLARVREQEEVLQALVDKFNQVNEEYRQKKAEGMTIADAFGYDAMLRAQEMKIKQAELLLAQLKQAEELKRAEMIAAKTDKATLDQLKDQKKEQYGKMVQKAEEQMIDEYVSTARVMARAAAL